MSSPAIAGPRQLTLRWDVADDYYIYRDKTQVRSSSDQARLGQLSIPGGEVQVDEYFGEQVVFHGEMVADLPILSAAELQQLEVEWNDVPAVSGGGAAATLWERFVAQAGRGGDIRIGDNQGLGGEKWDYVATTKRKLTAPAKPKDDEKK